MIRNWVLETMYFELEGNPTSSVLERSEIGDQEWKLTASIAETTRNCRPPTGTTKFFAHTGKLK
jgi:hypothetical protein